MNTEKLLMLLDQHQERQLAYRRLSERYRAAVNDVAKQQAGLTTDVDDLAQSIVLKSADALAKVSPDELAAAGISETQIRRLLAAKRLADRLLAESQAMAEELKQSQALTDRLLDYARLRGESVEH